MHELGHLNVTNLIIPLQSIRYTVPNQLLNPPPYDKFKIYDNGISGKLYLNIENQYTHYLYGPVETKTPLESHLEY